MSLMRGRKGRRGGDDGEREASTESSSAVIALHSMVSHSSCERVLRHSFTGRRMRPSMLLCERPAQERPSQALTNAPL